MEAPEVTFAFDGEGGISDAWLESEPHAHMLVEELMILANEAVAGLLGGRRRGRSIASTTRPSRSRSRGWSPCSPTSACRRRRRPMRSA